LYLLPTIEQQDVRCFAEKQGWQIAMPGPMKKQVAPS